MEHRADETLVARESLIKRLNCFINQNVFPLKITIFFFGNLVSLTLVGQTLCMVEFGRSLIDLNRCVEVSVSLFEF